METCTSCGESVTVERGIYNFKESVLKNVFLEGIEIVKCASCGNIDPIIPNMSALMECLAMAVITREGPLRADEVKFLRKFIGMNGAKFGSFIGADKSQVSKYETGKEKISRTRDHCIRAIAIVFGNWKHEERPKEIIAKVKNIGFSFGTDSTLTRYRYDRSTDQVSCIA